MSIRVMTLVWDNFKRSGSELVVMLALADWCNDEGGSLHPSISAIAAKARISESQARRIVHSFIDEGYLTVIANHNGGDKGQSRHYKMNLKLLATPCIDATPQVDQPTATTTSTSDTPCIDATPSTDAHDPLAPMRVSPSMGDTLTTKNHHKNHQYSAHEETKPKTKKAKTPLTEIPEGFGISDRVQAWADKNGHSNQLKAHLDNFILQCEAKRYQYANWDSAFMTAITKDWAGLRKQAPAGQAQQSASSEKVKSIKTHATQGLTAALVYMFKDAQKQISPDFTESFVRANQIDGKDFDESTRLLFMKAQANKQQFCKDYGLETAA